MERHLKHRFKMSMIVLEGLLHQEERFYNSNKHDYFNHDDNYLHGVEFSWRSKMCEWSYLVVDRFDYPRSVVSVAFDYIDRYLSKRSKKTKERNVVMDKYKFQLLAVTSLHVAMKLHRFHKCKITMNEFVILSRGIFTKKDIVKMEYELLKTLQWHMNPPTSSLYIYHILKYLHQRYHDGYEYVFGRFIQTKLIPFLTWNEIFERANYISELAVAYHEISLTNSSYCIALASISIAFDDSLKDDVYVQIKQDIMNHIFEILSLPLDDIKKIHVVINQMQYLFLPTLLEHNNFQSCQSHSRKRMNSPSSLLDAHLNEYPISCCDKRFKRSTF